MAINSATSQENVQQALLNNLQQKAGPIEVWTPPVHFRLSEASDKVAVNNMFDRNEIDRVIDPIDTIADELFEYENAGVSDEGERKEFIDNIKGQGADFGGWVYFPWSKSLVRYAEKDTHRTLRTVRNRDLITEDEQKALYEGTAAVWGLSVGSSAVRQMALAGVAGKFITADMDSLSLANTNRLEATQIDLGHKKIDILAKHVSLLDPYIEQVLLRDGIGEHNIDEIIEVHQPNFMVDAVDSLVIKALIRAKGAEYGVPVLMATDVGERSLLDVEAYGSTEDVSPFGGRISKEDYHKLLAGESSEDDLKRLLFEIVDPSNASPRLLESVMSMFEGKLQGLPQLGATAALGGIAVTRVAREIILGNEVRSGRSYIDMDSVLGGR